MSRLTEKEVCARLRVSRWTLSRLRAEGRIGFIRVGRRVIYDEVRHVQTFEQRQERNRDLA